MRDYENQKIRNAGRSVAEPSSSEQQANAIALRADIMGRSPFSDDRRESFSSWATFEERCGSTPEIADFDSRRCATYSMRGRSKVESRDAADDWGVSVASRAEAVMDLSIPSRVATPQFWDNVYVGTQFRYAFMVLTFCS